MNARTIRFRARPVILAALGLATGLLALAPPASGQGWKTPARRGASPGRPIPPLDPFRPEKGGVYSNLGLIDRLSRDAVEQIADSLRLPPGSEVTVLSSTWHEANWFVGTLLAETLTARGYRVKTGDWGAPADTAGASSRAAAPRGTQQHSGGGAAPQGPGGDDGAGEDAGAGGGTDSGKDGEGQEDEDRGSTDDRGAGESAAGADTTAVNPDSVEVAVDPVWGTPVEDGTPQAQRQEPAPETPAASAAAPAPGKRIAYPPGNVLDLRVLEFGIAYPSVGRRFLFGPIRFSRVGGVFLQVSSLVGPEGSFRQMTSAERHRVDRLSGSQRALVEGASYPFTSPSLKPPSLARYIEPTVVVAIVGSLVYLFYANQN